MSYRAFKRLLGETALELKARVYLSAGVLVLMFGSFYFYARQTEDLAYDQLTHTGRALVAPIVARMHVTDPELGPGLDEFQRLSEQAWPDQFKDYKYRLIRLRASRPDREPETVDDMGVLYHLDTHPEVNEQTRPLPRERAFVYYGGVRAGQSCVDCHTSKERIARHLGKDPADPQVERLVDPDHPLRGERS